MGIAGTPVLDGHDLYVVTRDGVARAYDLNTGDEKWNTQSAWKTDARTTPAVTDRLLLIAGAEGVKSINIGSGSHQWFHSIETAVYPDNITYEQPHGAITTTADSAIVPYAGGMILSVDTESGSLNWRFYTDGRSLTAAEKDEPMADVTLYAIQNGAVRGPVAVGDERTYFATYAGQAYALSTDTGEKVWSTEIPSGTSGSVTLSDGELYVPHHGGVTALEATSGQETWTTTYANTEEGLALSDSHLYVYAETGESRPYTGYLVKLRRDTGEEQWRTPMVGPEGSPVIAGDLVYVDGSATVAVRTSDGEAAITSETGFGDGPCLVASDHYLMTNPYELLVYS